VRKKEQHICILETWALMWGCKVQGVKKKTFANRINSGANDEGPKTRET